MSDKRRARRAKQARRDVRRAKKRTAESSGDPVLRDVTRRALNGHPVALLELASMAIHVARREPNEASRLHNILTDWIGTRNRETTALLAVIAELLVDRPAAQIRCRREVAERDEHLPRWIAALAHVEVYRAVRRTNVFRDVDELVIGMRLDGRHELTVAVTLDHNMWSKVVDAAVVPDRIDEVLARVAELSNDTDVFEMTLADARVWVEDALDEPTFARETETWPLYRAVVQWAVGLLPEGGEHRSDAVDWDSSEELCDRFFEADSAAPFTSYSHRALLLELFDSGTGDPLRWSPARVERELGGTPYFDDYIPLEVALDVPDLLRAFIPYAHAQSGIRDEVTSRTLAMVDELRTSYKREVLRRAEYLGLDDAV